MSQVFSVCFGAFNAGDICANPWNNGSLDTQPGKKAALCLGLRKSPGILQGLQLTIPALHPQQPREFQIYSVLDLKEIKDDGVLPFCMNLLLLGHIFQQKFPERTVQSGEEGKKKKPK